jgi:hypothetical protein
MFRGALRYEVDRSVKRVYQQPWAVRGETQRHSLAHKQVNKYQIGDEDGPAVARHGPICALEGERLFPLAPMPCSAR